MNSTVTINDGGQISILAEWYDERSEIRTDPPILVITSVNYRSDELKMICQNNKGLKCLQQIINQVSPSTGNEVGSKCITTIVGLKTFNDALHIITLYRGYLG